MRPLTGASIVWLQERGVLVPSKLIKDCYIVNQNNQC